MRIIEVPVCLEHHPKVLERTHNSTPKDSVLFNAVHNKLHPNQDRHPKSLHSGNNQHKNSTSRPLSLRRCVDGAERA